MTKLHYKIAKKMIDEVEKIFRLKLKEINLENSILIDDINSYLNNGILTKRISKLLENNIDNSDIYLNMKMMNTNINGDIEKFIHLLKIKNKHIKIINETSIFRQLLDYNIFKDWNYE